jgi:hypothetical protein
MMGDYLTALMVMFPIVGVAAAFQVAPLAASAVVIAADVVGFRRLSIPTTTDQSDVERAKQAYVDGEIGDIELEKQLEQAIDE